MLGGQPFDLGLVEGDGVVGVDFGLAILDAYDATAQTRNIAERTDAVDVDVALLVHEH